MLPNSFSSPSHFYISLPGAAAKVFAANSSSFFIIALIFPEYLALCFISLCIFEAFLSEKEDESAENYWQLLSERRLLLILSPDKSRGLLLALLPNISFR